MSVKELQPVEIDKYTTKETMKHRTKGERTRQKILDAAIEVLADKGLKGTTHRAIANHANLQLSLTTYYFKDIQELLHQAFKLNSDNILSQDHSVLEQAHALIEDTSKSSLRKKEVKLQLSQQLTDITTEYLFGHIKFQPTSLIVEQLLFTEIQVSPTLRELAHNHESAQLKPFEKICQFFNKTAPELDAKLMRTIFTQLKYSQLNKQADEISIDVIKPTVNKVISWVVGVK